MQTNQIDAPAKVIAQVNRAAQTAAKTLKRDFDLEVTSDNLREYGVAIIAEQTVLTGGRHPETPEALATLRTILRDMMIAHATAH
ncbi:hypothetical protein [Caballeronia sp. LZ019]|uniref:hypothetical protein n=1 Tax=Caballeronia sp. LZ019 TaxID=3038555 RepID=UPI002854CCE9|nr:hypothetical protein [Caballeronia sp. LZ019]MDR5811513.1 hypothetical protein [Caballeronia sp. LZ019]